MSIPLLDIFTAERLANDIGLCTACDHPSSHRRGFVLPSQRTVHLDRAIATRSTLHRALHEVGHILNDKPGMRSFEREAGAERYATQAMRAFGLTVPRRVTQIGAAYVARKKHHGDRIRAARV